MRCVLQGPPHRLPSGGPGPTPKTDIVVPLNEKRIHSQNPADIRDDLRVALASALGVDASINEQRSAAEIVASVQGYRDSQDALRAVLTVFGAKVFGAVLLHLIDGEGSLAGHAESMSAYLSSLEIKPTRSCPGVRGGDFARLLDK